MKKKALKAAFPLTLPVCVGFLFIGLSYGLFMDGMGFSFLYPTLMSLFIFAGSMQFVAVNLLVGAFDPLQAFILTLMVNARHLFYGISMLERFKGTGWKKFFLIFGMCDESFSINCVVEPPEGVDKGWFMYFVTLLIQGYWVIGSAIGGLMGYIVDFNTRGIEFVMTALFTVIFVGQWQAVDNHSPALIGIGCAALCLIVFGSANFMIPAMLAIMLCFALKRDIKLKKEKKEQ